MIDVLATGLIYLALGVAVWALVLIVLNRPFALNKPYGQALAGGVLLLTVVLLVQAIAGVINMGERDVDRLSFIGYLFGPVLVLPYTAFWAASEKSRWGPAVLVVGCLAIPVMIIRLRQIWEGHG